jgi:tetratricopeptide (TPR) repeat protein
LEKKAKAEREKKQSAPGLYAGEARLRLAELALTGGTSEQDLERAAELLKDLESWFERAAQREPSAALEAVSGILGDHSPGTGSAPSRFGRKPPVYGAPEQIVNRATASWYLPVLRKQHLLLRAYVQGQFGNRRDARRGLRRFADHIQNTLNMGLSRRDVLPRLQGGVPWGAVLYAESTWAKLTGPVGAKLRFGALLYVAGEHGRARAHLKAARKARRGTRTHRAAAELGLACCAYQRKGAEAAIERLKRFTEKLRGTAPAPRAQLMLANLLAGQEEGLKNARKLYRHLARRHAGERLGARARFSLALAASNHGDRELARKATQRAARAEEAGPYPALAKQLLSALRGQGASEKKDARGGGGPRVVEQHFTIPTNDGLRTNLPELKPTQLLRYQVKATGRKDCIVVRGVGIRLTELEPGVPRSRDGELSFYRAPVLYGVSGK